MKNLVCLYPFNSIKTAGGVSTASRRLASTIGTLNLSSTVIFYSSFSFKYSKAIELFIRLILDLLNLYTHSWRKKRIFLMTDTSSLVRTCLFILLLRFSLNFTPVIVDIRGGGPISRLTLESPNKIVLNITYILASIIVLQTSNFSPVPSVYLKKLRFVCNPLYLHHKDFVSKSTIYLQPPFLLSFAGRITETKGIPLLFDLLEGANDQFHLILAGSISLTSLNLKRMNQLINLGKITYIDNVSNRSACEMISQSHLFVHLSTHPWEGMPNSINDAVSVCTPVLATPIGFISDLYSNQHLTYLSDLSSDSVARKICDIRDSYGYYQAKAKNTFNYANKLYSLHSYELSILTLLT